MQTNQLYYLQLQAAKGVGAALQRRILRYIQAQQMSLEQFMQSAESIWSDAGLTASKIAALKSAETTAKKWSETAAEKKLRFLSILDDEYPSDLKRVLGKATPPILSLWGNFDLLQQPAVGFCGSRDASEQGITFAEDTAEQIAAQGWVVVSGHARGVDLAAHLTALQHNGATIIVAPEGLFNFKLRAALKRQMRREQVLIISEFQPNARWSVANAMTRNKTICGLSNAMIVVESGEKGGTFEAGKFALSAHVPLFVADYAHPAPSAAGNPFFIERGAVALRRSRETGRTNLTHLISKVQEHQQKLQEQPEHTPMQSSLLSSLVPA